MRYGHIRRPVKMAPGTVTKPDDALGSIVKPSITSQYSDCKNLFDKLLKNLETLDKKAIAQRLRDEFGRFRVWAGNAGAHRTGRVSLDYRLREASHIHAELTKLLGELNRALEKGEFYIFPPEYFYS